jgi:hypothetical protein
MIDKRPQADRFLIAELSGEARHHARWRELGSQAAGLCRKAGADLAAIEGWIEEGRRRGARARMPPVLRRPARQAVAEALTRHDICRVAPRPD